MFSGQNSSHSTKKGGRKTRFLISKNGVFARRPACGGFTFGENPTHPEAFHAAFGAPRRPPARPAPAGRPRSPRVRPAPAGRKAAPDAAPPDLGPVWRHVRAAGPRGPVFAWRPPRPPRGPCAPEKALCRPAPARATPPPRYPARLCPRGPVFARRLPRPARPAVPQPGCACAAPRLAPRPAAAAAPAPGAHRRPARRAAPRGPSNPWERFLRDRGPLSRKFPRNSGPGVYAQISNQPPCERTADLLSPDVQEVGCEYGNESAKTAGRQTQAREIQSA